MENLTEVLKTIALAGASKPKLKPICCINCTHGYHEEPLVGGYPCDCLCHRPWLTWYDESEKGHL